MKYYRLIILSDGMLVETLRIDERQKRVVNQLDYIFNEGTYQCVLEEENELIKDLTQP